MESWSAEVVKLAIVNCAGILDYSELRLKQAVVIQEFVSGKDVFVSPPTASRASHFDIRYSLRSLTTSVTRTASLASLAS